MLEFFYHNHHNVLHHNLGIIIIIIFSWNHFRMTVFIFSINWINQYYPCTNTLCFPNVIMFTKKSFIFYQKYIHLFLSKPFLYILIFGRNMHKCLFFSIFVTNEIFKILFKEWSLNTISLIFISFIEIGLSHWWNLCFSISVSSNFIIFSYTHFHV